MIRLAISGVVGPALQALASRLRGAVVDPPSERDAAVVLDSGPDAIVTAEMFLRSGKPVLLTATACPSLDAWERLLAAGGSNGRLAIVNVDRYLPSRRLIKEQLDAGKLGSVGLVRIHRWKALDAARNPAPPWLLDLDLVRWLVGAAPETIYATGRNASSYLQIHLGFGGGGMALVDYAGQIAEGYSYHSLSVIGSAGAAYADDQANGQLRFSGYAPVMLRADEGEQRNAWMVQEFIDSLQVRWDSAASLAWWREALSIADAVDRAVEAHQSWLRKGA